MQADLDKIVKDTNDNMSRAISHFEAEVLKIRAGKATPSMLDGLTVDYYGAPTPIAQVANLQVVDARTLTIQPWEKNMMAPIERSIMQANLGVTPQNDGIIIRIMVPALTEERRKQLVKTAKGFGEDAKVGIRSLRKEAMEYIKKIQKDGLPEDMAKDGETKIQNLTDANVLKVDKHIEQKEKEIMTI